MAKISETNVDIAEVKSVLGDSSNDLATLCKSGNLNMWSLKKPLHNRKGDMNTSDWYKGSTGNYGLLMPTFTVANTGNWTYAKPVGGESSPYCLGDFRGYDTAHRPVIAVEKDSIPDDINVNQTSSLAFLFHKNWDNTGGITPNDMGIGNYYFGVRVENGSGVAKEFTSSSTIGNEQSDAMVINFKSSPFNTESVWYNRNLTVKMFICSDSQPDQDGPGQFLGDVRGLPHGTFNGVEYVNQFNVRVEKSATFQIDITHVSNNKTSGWKTPESTGFIDYGGNQTDFSDALITSGPLAVKFKAIGNTSVTAGNIDFEVWPTYFDTTFTASLGSSLYKNGSSTGTITATPEGNEYVAYFTQCLNMDGNHAAFVDNVAKEVAVQLKQNGSSVGSTMFVAATSTYISGGGGGEEL